MINKILGSLVIITADTMNRPVGMDIANIGAVILIVATVIVIAGIIGISAATATAAIITVIIAIVAIVAVTVAPAERLSVPSLADCSATRSPVAETRPKARSLVVQSVPWPAARSTATAEPALL